MKVKLYSVRDIVSKCYKAPFTAVAQGEAIRSFITAVDNPQTQLHQFPDDFELHEIGIWDDETGVFETTDPVCIARAWEYVKRKEVNDVLHDKE